MTLVLHLVVRHADPKLDVAGLCMHDPSLLGILRPSADDLPDFFVIRELPPWVGEEGSSEQGQVAEG